MPNEITKFSVATEFGTSVVQIQKKGVNVFESTFRSKETIQKIMLNVNHQYDPIYESICYDDDGNLDVSTFDPDVDKPINTLSQEDKQFIVQCACAYFSTQYPGNRWRITISKPTVKGVDGCTLKCTPLNLHDVGTSHCITFLLMIGDQSFPEKEVMGGD